MNTINSYSIQGDQLRIPFHFGKITMKAFNPSTLEGVPRKFRDAVVKMIAMLPNLPQVAYLTVDGRFLTPLKTHRRPGAHIDGNYLPEICSWGNGGGNGWKVSEAGALSIVDHNRSYNNDNGGMLIAASKVGCRGWNGQFEGRPGVGGDCSHIDLTEGFLLKPNTVYYGNSRFIHESIPTNKYQYRTMIRITLPEDYPPIIV